MHQKEIDRAAGSAIGGTIAGLFIVFLIFRRYPKQSIIFGLLVALVIGGFGALKAWDQSYRNDALVWPGYDLSILDSDRGKQETAEFRKLMREPTFFKKLNSREFLIRFLPTDINGRYGKNLCEALIYRPGEPKAFAVIMSSEGSSFCMSDIPEPVLGHWKNGVWRIASLSSGEPLDYYQIKTLADLISTTHPWEPTGSQSKGLSPWMRTIEKARWNRDWRTFYPKGEWVSVVFPFL